MTLCDMQLKELVESLAATERLAGKDSESADILRRAICRKLIADCDAVSPRRPKTRGEEIATERVIHDGADGVFLRRLVGTAEYKSGIRFRSEFDADHGTREIQKLLAEAIDAAIAEERERCATIAKNSLDYVGSTLPAELGDSRKTWAYAVDIEHFIRSGNSAPVPLRNR